MDDQFVIGYEYKITDTPPAKMETVHKMMFHFSRRFFMNKSQIKGCDNQAGKNVIFVVVSFILVMIILTFFSMNVYSQSLENAIQIDKQQTDQLEKAYLKEMKHILNDYGCPNAGITMTKVYGEAADLYEVAVHHADMRYLDQDGMNELDVRLKNLTAQFPHAKFVFSYSY